MHSMPGLVHGYNFHKAQQNQLFLELSERGSTSGSLYLLRQQLCGPWGRIPVEGLLRVVSPWAGSEL